MKPVIGANMKPLFDTNMKPVIATDTKPVMDEDTLRSSSKSLKMPDIRHRHVGRTEAQ